MEPPLGFYENFVDNKVWKFKKALYKLKQSSRVWFRRFTKVMLAMEYKQSQRYHLLFIKHSSSGGVTALLVYNIIVTRNDKAKRNSLQKCLATEFEINELANWWGYHILFIKHSSSRGITTLLVYGIIVTRNDKAKRHSLWKCLATEFEIKELGNWSISWE